MKKFFVTTIVVLIAIMLFSVNSYAADDTAEKTDEEEIKWTDFSNIKVEFSQNDENNTFRKYYMKVTGITLNKKSLYEVYIKFEDEQLDVTKDKSDKLLLDSDINKEIEMYSINIKSALNKDIYCYIVEKQNGKCGTPYKTKIPRLQQHSLGNRMRAYFHSTSTAIYCYEDIIYYTNNYEDREDRKVKLKIGTITDNNILLSIQKGEANCLQKLLDYAKSAKAIYTETISIDEKKSITSNLNITNHAYYYVYMVMDDENGKYYPVEDVSLYQALVGETIGKNLYDYLDDNFKWNLESQEPTTPVNKPNPTTPVTTPNNTKTPDTTVAAGKLPKTGIGIGLISLIIIAISGLIFAYFKYDKLKGI